LSIKRGGIVTHYDRYKPPKLAPSEASAAFREGDESSRVNVARHMLSPEDRH
jgi:hypothetical protein